MEPLKPNIGYEELIILPILMALASSNFHCSATSLAKGSSGLGALSRACIDNNTVRICRAGLHLSEIGRRKIWNCKMLQFFKLRCLAV